MIQELLYSFPWLTNQQVDQLISLKKLYSEWNGRINVISRKDIDQLEIHHILHSLFIGRIFSFQPGTRIMDAGTGGGFPGIPLSILFPQVEFTLVDSIAKKIQVVTSIKNELGLKNVKPVQQRLEEITGSFSFITGRAVTKLPQLFPLLKSKINTVKKEVENHGILYLKGGDFEDELKNIKTDYHIYKIADYFKDPWFETKSLIHLFNF